MLRCCRFRVSRAKGDELLDAMVHSTRLESPMVCAWFTSGIAALSIEKELSGWSNVLGAIVDCRFFAVPQSQKSIFGCFGLSGGPIPPKFSSSNRIPAVPAPTHFISGALLVISQWPVSRPWHYHIKIGNRPLIKDEVPLKKTNPTMMVED